MAGKREGRGDAGGDDGRDYPGIQGGRVSDFLVDANVLLDVATTDPVWSSWSERQLRNAAARGAVCINPIIFAEVAPAFSTEAELESWLEPSIFRRLALPYAAGWRVAEAFRKYRRSGGAKLLPLPDFYIGAHAETDKLTLITRDAARYRTYFPSIDLITP